MENNKEEENTYKLILNIKDNYIDKNQEKELLKILKLSNYSIKLKNENGNDNALIEEGM